MAVMKTISWDHDQGAVSLRRTSDHVLDEVTTAWCINAGEVPLLCVELLGGAHDAHATLTLLLLAVHVEGKCKSPCPSAQLNHLSEEGIWQAKCASVISVR